MGRTQTLRVSVNSNIRVSVNSNINTAKDADNNPSKESMCGPSQESVSARLNLNSTKLSALILCRALICAYLMAFASKEPSGPVSVAPASSAASAA